MKMHCRRCGFKIVESDAEIFIQAYDFDDSKIEGAINKHVFCSLCSLRLFKWIRDSREDDGKRIP